MLNPHSRMKIIIGILIGPLVANCEALLSSSFTPCSRRCETMDRVPLEAATSKGDDSPSMLILGSAPCLRKLSHKLLVFDDVPVLVLSGPAK
jgi:hypothetical protein